MSLPKWILFAAALVMMAGTGLCLSDVSRHHRLGASGVVIGPKPLYDESGKVAARQSIILPDDVLGAKARPLPLTQVECDGLPKDTTFGRALYYLGQQPVQVSVVLMGTDRTSIHDPHYCLVGQNWHIDKTEHVTIPIDGAAHYELPALKLSLSREVRLNGQLTVIHGFYVYWFVSGDHVTADMSTRFLSLGWTMLKKGELERWAYISYLVPCLPGQEQVTYQRLEQFIRASVPSFQVTALTAAQQ